MVGRAAHSCHGGRRTPSAVVGAGRAIRARRMHLILTDVVALPHREAATNVSEWMRKVQMTSRSPGTRMSAAQQMYKDAPRCIWVSTVV